MNQEIEIIDLREKYFKVSNQIFEENLDIYEIGVYSVLCRFANNNNSESFPSISRLQSMLKVSRPKIINTLKSLTDKGIIHKKTGNTGYSNRYYLMSLPSKREKLVNTINYTSKQDLPPSKPRLPEVVNEVYSKKTNTKRLREKTNIKTDNILLRWNKLNNDHNAISKIMSITKPRKKKIYARLKENKDFLDDFVKCIELINTSTFLQGHNNKNWSVSFDWLIANDTNYIKVLEGNYNKTSNAHKTKRKYDNEIKASGVPDHLFNEIYNMLRSGELLPNQIKTSAVNALKLKGIM